MKTILITAPSSGSGKTTITMGIIRALRNKGLDLCAFKTGPDYIDRAFLEKASGKRAGNLDMHLQGQEGVKAALAMAEAEFCVIEGAMGYFDGIGNTYQNSSYDIARKLNINSVLVYTPKGEMFTAIPKIKGMAEFQDSSIKAVIFNNVTDKYYHQLKEALEKYTDIKVLGYIPKLEAVELKSRHLGLVQSVEVDDLDERINSIAAAVEEHVNLEELVQLMKPVERNVPLKLKKRSVRAAIALDKAFSFYYTENLKLLERTCEVEYFSPLEDKELPSCDFLYLGGGYPEVFAEALSANKSMLESIRSFAEKGGYIYAECGGYMYLNERIEAHSMVGIFKGESKLTKGLQRFGYIDAELEQDCILGRCRDKITAHEFHKSVTETKGEAVLAISKTMGEAKWQCGYLYKNTYGGYPHINFIGNLNILNNILDGIERSKRI